MFEKGEWVGMTDAGRILGLSVPRVRELTRQGRIPATETAIGRLFKREELERIAAERQAMRLAAARKADGGNSDA